MQIDWLAKWQEVRDKAESYWRRVKEFVAPYYRRAADFVIRYWKRLSEWYMAQQEVVKIRSEVSHERITVTRATLAFMETWGLGSRNIFHTMWHLIWRPGFMMSDYLNGHRKRYLQPFFMFFVLTLILVQVAYVLEVPMAKNADVTLTALDFVRTHRDSLSADEQKTIMTTAKWLNNLHDWRDENKAWDIIIHSVGIVLMTWLLWRKSPRIGSAEWVVDNGMILEGYNFAEIVTVIAYILCQLQIISLVVMIFFHTLPFDHMKLSLLSIIPILCLYVILFIDFKQLFQRDWWATAWRTAIIVFFV